MKRLSSASKVTSQPFNAFGTSALAPRMTESPSTRRLLLPGGGGGDGSGSFGTVAGGVVTRAVSLDEVVELVGPAPPPVVAGASEVDVELEGAAVVDCSALTTGS